MPGPTTRLTIVNTLLILLWISLTCVQALPEPTAKILAVDPPPGSQLAFAEKVYLRLGYHSSVPLRFRVSAYRHGEKREIGALISKASLHASGPGEALVWLSFNNPTHIDQIHIELLDVQWTPINTLSFAADLVWQAAASDKPPGPVASWVEELDRVERRKHDYFYDPAPVPHGNLNEFVFLLTVLAAPTYLGIQILMLRRYRGRWRELAAIPLVSAMPLILYGLLVGYPFDFELWLGFVFRATPFALCYLVALWIIKRVRTRGAKAAQP